MQRTVKRRGRISWGRWHHVMMLRSLQMMVMSGVVRRADLAPPPVPFDFARDGVDGPGQDETVAAPMAEPGWLARIFFSREYLVRRYHQGL
ncbi:MAG: hypothetical protein OEV08_13140 [Nitrospira sp.]|nr:hypothetical protein [Nitrospira sp.]